MDPKSHVDMVRQFHQVMGAPISETPCELTADRKRLRLLLALEELQEFAQALGCGLIVEDRFDFLCDALRYDQFHGKTNLVEAADALADIEYINAGTAIEMGIPLDAVFAEVHRSNMTKTPGNNRADGKILKGDGYEPPRIAELLNLEKRANPYDCPYCGSLFNGGCGYCTPPLGGMWYR